MSPNIRVGDGGAGSGCHCGLTLHSPNDYTLRVIVSQFLESSQLRGYEKQKKVAEIRPSSVECWLMKLQALAYFCFYKMI